MPTIGTWLSIVLLNIPTACGVTRVTSRLLKNLSVNRVYKNPYNNNAVK